MAVVVTVPNHFKYLVGTKAIDFANDTFKIILMNTTFTFAKDTHAELADVTADQLSTANGYTQDDKTLAGVAVAEDDTDDRLEVTWSDPVWTASSGSIGPTGAAIVIDTTVANSPVVMCIDFGTDYTVVDTATFSVKDIAFYGA